MPKGSSDKDTQTVRATKKKSNNSPLLGLTSTREEALSDAVKTKSNLIKYFLLRAINFIKKHENDVNVDKGETERNIEYVKIILLDFFRSNPVEFSEQLVKAVSEDQNLYSALKSAFNKAGYRIYSNEKALLSPINSINNSVLLWKDRSKTEYKNPAQFIRGVYGEWLDKGLTRIHIKALDPPLYDAYAQWIKPDRHPEDTIAFSKGRGKPRRHIDDPIAAITRRRDTGREASARYREKRNLGSSKKMMSPKP